MLESFIILLTLMLLSVLFKEAFKLSDIFSVGGLLSKSEWSFFPYIIYFWKKYGKIINLQKKISKNKNGEAKTPSHHKNALHYLDLRIPVPYPANTPTAAQ